MNSPLSPKGQRVLAFIVAFKQQHDGCSPTIREIQSATGHRTTSTVFYWLKRLEDDGYIRRPRYDQRAIEVIGGEWKAPRALRGLPQPAAASDGDAPGG